MTQTDVRTLGKYEVRGVIGRGAAGIVYDGWDPVIRRRVAIKTIRLPPAGEPGLQEEISRFRREAQAAGRLSHPNIVSVFDYGETDREAFTVMEFVNGTSLKAILDQNHRFTVPEIASIMRELLAGLQYSHDHGIVHRDIKPANVMLSQSAGGVKIADFGIARIEASSLTQTATIIGTPAYMSPEQFQGEPVDARSDIYAAGVMLYQLLTGDRPFDGSMTAVMHKVLNSTPPSPSHVAVTVAPALDAVVAKAIARRPRDRFDSAAEFSEAIEEAIHPERHLTRVGVKQTSPDSPAGTVSSGKRATRGRRMQVAGAVAALLLVAGGTWLGLHARRPEPRPVPVVASLPGPESQGRDREAAATRTLMPPPASHSAIGGATTPTQLATATEDATTIRAALAEVAASISCGIVRFDVTDDGMTLVSGLIGSGAASANLRERVTNAIGGMPVSWTTQAFPPTLCKVANAVSGASSGGMEFTLQGGVTRLRDGDWFGPSIRLPPFRAHLLIEYIGNDGTVYRMIPDDIDPDRAYMANQRLNLGSPLSERWKVGPPFGTDMLLAIASSALLFDPPRPVTESADQYGPALRQAIKEATQRGQSVVARAILLDTIAK